MYEFNKQRELITSILVKFCETVDKATREKIVNYLIEKDIFKPYMKELFFIHSSTNNSNNYDIVERAKTLAISDENIEDLIHHRYLKEYWERICRNYEKKLTYKSQHISIGCVNIHGINQGSNNKMYYLQRWMKLANLDIVLVSETWLNTQKHIPQFEGYNVWSVERSYFKGGGLLIYTKNIYDVSSIEAPSKNSNVRTEIKWIRLISYDKKYAIGCVYWKPGVNKTYDEDFIIKLSDDIVHVKSECDEVVIGGNFNCRLPIDKLEHEIDTRGKELWNFIKCHNLSVYSVNDYVVGKYTRIDEGTQRDWRDSTIDYIIGSNNIVQGSAVFIDENRLWELESDHVPITLRIYIDGKLEKVKKQKRSIWKINRDTDWNKFKLICDIELIERLERNIECKKDTQQYYNTILASIRSAGLRTIGKKMLDGAEVCRPDPERPSGVAGLDSAGP